ncbi:hypothetical protein ABT352_14840 [Streptosporangium sp. NPDC000563]|uniref:hypothetical protein n=1 Tax=Streptosporangium sp. NPDC000563 TaxID=3154366 RepID=UPI00331779A1
MKRGQLAQRVEAQDTAIMQAPTDFSGAPIVIHDHPTWIEIVPDDDGFGSSVQRVWRLIVAPFRALAVMFLLLTERWYTFAFVVTSVAAILVIYATR